MKAAQVGATEAGNNWIGFVIHHAPGSMLAVLPTVELATPQAWGPVTTLAIFTSPSCSATKSLKCRAEVAGDSGSSPRAIAKPDRLYDLSMLAQAFVYIRLVIDIKTANHLRNL